MPKPNCTEEIDVGPMDFGQVGRRVVEGRFDGGSMTSDGGVVLLGQVDRKLGLMDAAARCIGHKDYSMLVTVYGRWIDTDSSRELERIWEGMQNMAQIAPKITQKTAILIAK